MAHLSRGDRVRDPGDRSKSAVVTEGPTLLAGTRYYAIQRADGEELFYPENELTPEEKDSDSPVAWLIERSLADPETFSRLVTQLKLSSGLTDVLYSFSSSRTLFRVHQFKPVLKLLESPSPRLLLADEVGLGKTIEAGLVWAELDARSPVQRVLVLCPSGLRRKWQIELERRFDREVPLVDRREFLAFVDRYAESGDAARFAGIASFSQLRHDTVLSALSERPPTFDLVIVDEAHALRNSGTKQHQLGELLSQHSAALLFLSATPVNLGTSDLFNLLKLLRPDEFSDPEQFKRQLEPNQHINRAGALLASKFPPDFVGVINALRRVEETQQAEAFLGDPAYVHLLERLVRLEPPTRRDVAQLQGDVAALNTLASVYTRTRKRDLPDHTVIRRARTIAVTVSDIEAAAYLAVVSLVAAIQRGVSGVAPALAAVMPARQAASCLPVMSAYLREALSTGRFTTDDLSESEEDDDELGQGAAEFAGVPPAMVRDLEALCLQAERGEDSKLDALVGELRSIGDHGPMKVLLFSTFLRTLSYLAKRLGEAGYRTRTMTGGTPVRDRDQLIDDFRTGDLEILLCSEIGSEGLDFEFCNVIVNYDLPWNPMRLEQRIGRLDRFGQVHPIIHVLNFEVPGTIDSEIFLRLFNRIGIFEGSIGELEPILGGRMKSLTLAMADPDLSMAEQQRVADQVALAVELEKAAIEVFDEDRERLIGADSYVESAVQAAHDQHRYITQAELERFVGGFLRAERTGASLIEGADPMIPVLQGSPGLADHLRTHGRKFSTSSFLQLLTRIESSGAIPVTFDPDTALKHSAQFINFRHPLVRSIESFHRENPGSLPRGGFVEMSHGEHCGDWIFFVVLFSASGMFPRRQLFAIATHRGGDEVSEDVGVAILSHLAGSEVRAMEQRDIPILQAADAALAYETVLGAITGERDAQQLALQERNDALISRRQLALRQGSAARATSLRELAANFVESSPIRRMRLSQASNVEERARMEIADLEERRRVQVGLTILAGGLATIRPA